MNGTEVFVAVAATTAVGEGDESTPRTAGTPGLVPGAPTDVTADPRDRSAVVYWSPPASNGGLAITNYIVRAYDTVTGGSVKRTCTTATVGCTLTTLTNGTSYWVEVVAENAIGAGSPSTPRVEVRPKTVAGAPGAVSVSAGDRRAEIRWAAPTASLNGQRIIGYEARAFNSSTFGSPLASCRTTASGTASPTTFCTITGLTNGWDYYVDVVAQTEAGDGPASSPRVKFVPSTLPAPPLRVTAVRAAGGVSVSWDQPPSGGTVITKFTARAYSQESGGSALANCSTSALSCTIAGIDGRTEVYVDVTAANAIGEGTASAPRVGVELGSAPGSPRWVVGSPRQRSVKVSWAPPVWSGNKPVTGYQARAWSAATAGSELASCQATAPATACTIGSLTAGSTVFVEVAARSDLGVGVPSARTGIRIVQGRPSVPREVSAFAAPRRIAVFWAPPASDGGRPLTEATAYAWNAAGDELQGSCTVRGSALRAGAMCVIDGLRPAQVLSVHVIASSADGEGPQSDAVRVITRPGPPAPPQGIGISPRDGALAVHWTAPEFDGGSPVTGYIVRAWSQAQAGTVLEACQTDAGDTDCTLGGLRNGATYFIDVLAENAFGTSPSAGRTPASVASEMPAEPSGVNVVPADAALLIRWDNAAGTLNSTVTGYRARAYLKRTGGAVVGECTAAKEGSCTIGGLRNGVVYWIAVEAQNAGGYGDPSNPRIRKAPVA